MRLSSISLNNLRRRKAKTLFLCLGLLIGVATVVTLFAITRAMRKDIDVRLDEYGANVIITPKPAVLPLTYGSISVPGFSTKSQELTEADIPKIRSIKNRETINIVAPKLLEGVVIEGRKVLLVGVRFPEELRLKRWWRLKGDRPSGSDDVVLGSEVAKLLDKASGDSIGIGGRMFRVASVLKPTGSQEDSLVYADLQTVQALFGKPGRLSMIEVAAWCQTCPIERIVAQIGAKLPWTKVSMFKQAVAAKANTLAIIDRFSIALLAAIASIGGLVVLATMMSSVNERTREIGIFRAIGFRKGHIAAMVLFEALLVSFASGAAGWLLGVGIAKALAPQMTGPRVVVGFEPAIGALTVGAAILVGLLASIYPARRAANFDPVEALRAI